MSEDWGSKPFLTMSELQDMPTLDRRKLMKQKHIWKWNEKTGRLVNSRHRDNQRAEAEAAQVRFEEKEAEIERKRKAKEEKIVSALGPKDGQYFYVHQRLGWEDDKPSGWLRWRVVKWEDFELVAENLETGMLIELDVLSLVNFGYCLFKDFEDDFFYTEKGKAKAIKDEDAALEFFRRARASRRASSAFQWARDTIDPILPIPAGADRATIMSTFRQKAKIHHPDHGGDPADFRRLCDAKDRALKSLQH